MVVFYALSPLPALFSKRYSDDASTSSALKELCYFVTTGIVLSAFALPIVLARSKSGEQAADHVVRKCLRRRERVRV